MAEFLLKHICGGVILLIISIVAYLVYCGIGYVFFKLMGDKK